MSSQKVTQDVPPAPKKPIDYKRRDDFIEFYANNVFFQGSNWDLKLTFGQLDQSAGPNTVVQNCAVTLPWAQMKLMAFFLNVHVAAHEGEIGRVIIPTGIVPEFPAQAPKDAKPETYRRLRKMYEDFIAENPEAK